MIDIDYLEDITWWRKDMNFIFQWQNNILRTSARVRLWKINHLGPGCSSFYEFYDWYIFQ